MQDFGLLTITGPDAPTFLQGQLTCDINEITADQPVLGAHCDYKGRVLATFWVFKNQTNYYLWLPIAMIAPTRLVLNKYAVFSKVQLTSDEQTLPTPVVQWLNKHPIDRNIAHIYPETIGLFTPHDLNYHQVGGISFTKGCFTGQEVIARMHYRGKLKQHLYRVHIAANHMPAPADKIISEKNTEKKEVGTLVNIWSNGSDYLGLAVLQDQTVKDTHSIIYVKTIDQIVTILQYTDEKNG